MSEAPNAQGTLAVSFTGQHVGLHLLQKGEGPMIKNRLLAMEGGYQSEQTEQISANVVFVRAMSLAPEMLAYINNRAELGDENAIALVAKAEGRS